MAIPAKVTEFIDRPGRDNSHRNRAMPKELGNPFTILDINLSSMYIFDVLGICMNNLQALFKGVKDGFRVDNVTFHSDSGANFEL
jgi:hypothetical protein